MVDRWYEITQAIKDNRRELILSGEEVSRKIAENGLDSTLFDIDTINYLNISNTCLNHLPDELGNLQNITNLVLHSNLIKNLPNTIGNLKKLKVLDCSQNELEEVPSELRDLPQLMTLNLRSNQFSYLPPQISNAKLCSIDLSNNKFEEFPDICYAELIHLAEVRLNNNLIKVIPTNISVLPSLKLLDLGANQISVIPGEVADCTKLKDLNLKDNPLNDKRLLKLVNQCRMKQVLDYVRQNCIKIGNISSINNTKSKKGKKSSKNLDNDNIDSELELCVHKLRILKVPDTNFVIKIMEDVKKVRPFILGCVVKNLTFTEQSFKKFIQLQTRLHENICEKRNAATLATHDFDSLLDGNLIYTAQAPNDIKIKPLMRTKEFTGAELFQQLQTEAENLRKEKKRNVYSGIHKYLYLLEGKPLYACLLDSSNQVISFPPITNSDITKMSIDTKNMFVEVTSALNQQICKKVLDEFLRELLIQGLGCESNSENKFNELTVEQVKIVDIEGNMKSVYPSRTDAIYEDKNLLVIRQ
ncbi:PREDICTED: leucine-rich repeat-containing protein 47-like [Ceratosolen solmsi marchali]|uniref:Leucine-rich repeat-containing protein 47-like n=1 Tax=Ceratosolen solmsi marchali TaxID=326594 RepID=A0AAJ7DW05_9HYME|nr:PREDICTED: leucine-rich repeat-containing protein 47-like [Ceratosolen solmsi marchali]